MPTLERADSDGDGAGELGIELNSLASAAGAAAQSGTAGLSCPAGMVLDGGLCRTPKVETVAAVWVCPQAGDGYELVVGRGELGVSHSCQKTVPAHCTGGKILHEGQCRARTVERQDPGWHCDAGVLETTLVGPGYAYSCRVAVDPPTCPTGETYRNNRCETEETFHRTRGYEWTCSTGTLVTTSGDHGVAHSCRITLRSLSCPDGETYRNNRCEEEQTYYRTRGYTWTCSAGTRVTTSGDHGTSYSCRIALSPPTCPPGETYRNSRCEEEQTFYRTRGYTWTCSAGTRVTTSGDHGTSYSCRIALSPPTCPNGETYRNSRCEEEQTYYNSRPYSYSCPSGYTLKTSTVPPTCSKTETYRVRRCAFDPVAGEQCWYENRTRTLTKPPVESCPSGYSSDGTGCTANTASTRWVRTSSTPTRYRYVPAAKSCIRGYSDNGAQCQSDTASTRWRASGSTPTRYRYVPAASSCIRGYSDNGAQCESDTASTRWVRTSSTPTRYRYVPAAKSCIRGYSDNGAQCESDTASTRWKPTASTPVTSRSADAVPVCDAAGFAWNLASGKCEKTTYTDPTAPLTKTVGRSPMPLCADGYDPAGAGQCSRTVLGEPTAVPDGAGCITGLGTLTPGNVSRSGVLAAGCVSLVKGDEQSPHWARRFSLAVGAASTATFTASSAAVDVFVSVLSGSGASVAVVASDDDSGAGTDANVSGVALAPGITYTVEVTTSTAGPTGAFALTGTIALAEPPVVISGLADDTRTGNGTVTASAEFTVEPADAVCTAATAATGAKPKIAAGSAADKRVVSLAGAVPFSHIVTVRCDAAGRTATEAAVTLAGTPPAVSITGLDDSTPATPSTAYASDKITVEPPTARCSGTADGHGVGTPWVSSRTSTRTVVARVQPGGAATVTVTCTAAGHSPASAQALFSYTPRPQITSAATFAPKDACTAVAPDPRTDADADAVWQCSLDEGAALAATLTVVAGTYRVSDAWNTTGGITAKVRTIPAPVPAVGPDNAATDDWRTTAAATLRCTTDGAATAVLTAGRRPGHRTHTTRIRIDCQPRVQISGLHDAFKIGDGTVTASSGFAVSPADATCTAAASLAKPTVTEGDTAAERVVSVALAVPFSRTVTVTCEADGRPPGEATAELSGAPAVGTVTVAAGLACTDSPGTADYACTVPRGGTLAVTATVQGARSDLSLGWSATGGATVASPAQTAVAPVPSGGFSRTSTAVLSCTADGTVTVAVTAGIAAKTVAVDVDCVGTGTAVACDDALGSLAHGIITRSGEITADAGCISAMRRSRSAAVYYARRHTFTLDGPAVVTFDHVGSAESAADRLDTYLLLHRGHSTGAVTPLRRNSGGRLGNVRLAAGDYTVEATTQQPDAIGGYTLTVNVRYRTTVAVSGLAGAARAGTGPVRVADAFIVTPPTSNCTAVPPTAVVVTPPAAISDPRLAGQRTVSAALSGPGAAEVTVRCSAAGHRPAQQSAVLTHAGALSSITARVTGDGGQCVKATPPTGVDAAYRCTFGRGNTVTVAADAVATGPTLGIAWDTAAGVTLRPPSQTAVVPSFAPGSTEPMYQRTATAELGCTARGTATATVTLPGTTAAKTALLTVICADAVAITGLADVTKHGTGSVVVSGDFTVSPTTATCSADPAAAGVTVGLGGQRTVSASITAPGTLAVTVTCRAGGYANGIRQVDLAAALPCAERLGELAAGTTATNGTIVADPACTSAERHRVNPSRSLQKNYYARRHTFTLASPAWVTVSLVGANRFGTYLVLLEGHNPDGTVLASDNNSGRRGDRLAGVFLESGRYTVEATTSRPRSFRDHRPIGDYGLTISVDFMPRVDQPSRLSVEKGGTISESWPYEPAAATVTLAASDSLAATVSRSTTTGSKGSATLRAAPTRIGKYTATVTYANSTGSLSEDTEIVVVDGSCSPTGPDRLRARRMHHHDDGHGHAGCNAHTPPTCETSKPVPWTPDGRDGHFERNLERCGSTELSGVIRSVALEKLPWTPYDIDRAGNPIVCEHAKDMNLGRHERKAIEVCMNFYNLEIVTWKSGFDIDVAIQEYETERRRTVPDDVRSDLEAIQQAVDYQETIPVGTYELPRRTGSRTLDEAFVQIVCEGVVDFAVDKGVKAASKKVGGWAKNKFPAGTVLRGAVKLSTILSIATVFTEVTYSNFATNVACD